MKILVPIDGSDLSEAMLVPGIRLAQGGELLMVRVIDDARDQQAQDAAEGYLEAHRKKLSGKGVEVRWCLEPGDPAEKILLIAEERGPDFVAMATHGQSAVATERTGRGSVAERVLRSSQAPLLLCNPRGTWAAKTRPFAKLLVALDGSAFSDLVLPSVEHFAKTYESSVTLFQVFPAKSFDRSEAAAKLEPQQKRLAEAGIEAETLVASGDPAAEILKASEDFDLVCMSTHGRTGLTRWWLGSVAEKVMRACERPLLVVRPQKATA